MGGAAATHTHAHTHAQERNCAYQLDTITFVQASTGVGGKVHLGTRASQHVAQMATTLQGHCPQSQQEPPEKARKFSQHLSGLPTDDDGGDDDDDDDYDDAAADDDD
eukprot:3701186-Amphidinium_carterae.1